MLEHKTIRHLTIVLLWLLSSCGSPSIQVQEVSIDTIAYEETIHINNCGGQADSEQTALRSFSTSIEGTAQFNVGYEVVEGRVGAKYGQYRGITKSIKLIAPPETNMEIVLRWSEEVRAGNVTVNGEAGTYSVHVPIAVDQISSQDLGCGSGASQIQPTPLVTPPTATPQSSQINFPNITVSANASKGVQFAAPSSGNYKFTIQEGKYCTPSICRSIIRGYLGRDIVWKEWYGLPHPMDQDYELGCWEQETALNRNCAVGMSVIVYMDAQQYVRWVIMEDKNSFADNNGNVILSVMKLP